MGNGPLCQRNISSSFIGFELYQVWMLHDDEPYYPLMHTHSYALAVVGVGVVDCASRHLALRIGGGRQLRGLEDLYSGHFNASKEFTLENVAHTCVTNGLGGSSKELSLLLIDGCLETACNSFLLGLWPFQ